MYSSGLHPFYGADHFLVIKGTPGSTVCPPAHTPPHPLASIPHSPGPQSVPDPARLGQAGPGPDPTSQPLPSSGQTNIALSLACLGVGLSMVQGHMAGGAHTTGHTPVEALGAHLCPTHLYSGRRLLLMYSALSAPGAQAGGHRPPRPLLGFSQWWESLSHMPLDDQIFPDPPRPEPNPISVLWLC